MPENKKIINGVLYGVSAVIFNYSKEVLMLYRAFDDYESGWEFVKGGLQFGESHFEAAIREIQEEVGQIEIEFITELPSTYYVDVHYRQKNYSFVEKKTLVFLYVGGVISIGNEHSQYKWTQISRARNICWVENGKEILDESYAAFNQWLLKSVDLTRQSKDS